MIIGGNSNLILQIKILQESEYNFYQSGSRYYGNYTNKSDHDFVVEEDKNVILFLTKNNYKDIPSYGGFSLDNLTLVVFRKIIGNTNIDIVIIKKGFLKVKLLSLKFIKENIFLLDNFLKNKDRRDLINSFHNSLYRTIMEGGENVLESDD